MLYKLVGDNMSKRFKTKKKLNHDILIKTFLIIVFIYIIIKCLISLVLKIPIIDFTFKANKLGYFKKIIIDSTIKKPKYFLGYYKKENEEAIYASYVIKSKPILYIYNTHQKEEYVKNKTVLDASYLFKKELDKYNVNTIVENRDITEFMRANNMDYSYSYKASRYYIEDVKSKYNVDLYIDLHRDALDKKLVTTTINNKDYAKILFVVGKEYKSYEKNYKLAKKINTMISLKYPNLSRGVILKGGANSNGIYNQDLSNNMILLEIGSQESNFEEISNTISILAPIIGEYLNEKN